MKVKLMIIALIIITGFITCIKSSYNTTPTLKFIGVNSIVFPRPSVISFELQCTDKEGDVVDTIWIQKISKVSACEINNFIDSFPIPNFQPPKNVKAEFDFTYNYASVTPPNLQGCSQQDDTCYFRFWMHDKAQHVSDTAQSPDVVLLQQ